MDRIIISSISQFIGYAQKNPTILNIPSFTGLRSALTSQQPSPTKGCNCKAKQDLSRYRSQFEAAFSVLSENEQATLKRLLNTEKVCYYKKEPNGQLKLNCF